MTFTPARFPSRREQIRRREEKRRMKFFAEFEVIPIGDGGHWIISIFYQRTIE